MIINILSNVNYLINKITQTKYMLNNNINIKKNKNNNNININNMKTRSKTQQKNTNKDKNSPLGNYIMTNIYKSSNNSTKINKYSDLF